MARGPGHAADVALVRQPALALRDARRPPAHPARPRLVQVRLQLPRVRHRVVSTAPVAQFACPTCEAVQQAVLQEADTTVRCECGTMFIARLPPAPPAPKQSKPKENTPPGGQGDTCLYGQPPPIPCRALSDDTSSIQSIPRVSSASSVVVSTAPSVISVVSGEDPTQDLTPPPEHEPPSEAAATPLTTFVRLLGLG